MKMRTSGITASFHLYLFHFLSGNCEARRLFDFLSRKSTFTVILKEYMIYLENHTGDNTLFNCQYPHFCQIHNSQLVDQQHQWISKSGQWLSCTSLGLESSTVDLRTARVVMYMVVAAKCSVEWVVLAR